MCYDRSCGGIVCFWVKVATLSEELKVLKWNFYKKRFLAGFSPFFVPDSLIWINLLVSGHFEFTINWVLQVSSLCIVSSACALHGYKYKLGGCSAFVFCI